MPTSRFASLIKDRRDDLVTTIVRRLKSSSAPHYRKIDQQLLRGRSERLVDSFLRAMRGEYAPFVDYVEKLTAERIDEGYHLQEIQLALSILEERSWQVAVEHCDVATLVPTLALVTTTIGTAKDRLAQLYLAHKERCESRVASLEKRCEELFKGTEGHALPDD
jgi:hypothetical protein